MTKGNPKFKLGNSGRMSQLVNRPSIDSPFEHTKPLSLKSTLEALQS